MAQKSAVVRATLASSAAGTTDFTSSGFGTVAAAIIITCNGNATNNPQTDALFTIGFWDGTNQRSMGSVDSDNQATTVTRTWSDDSFVSGVSDGAGGALYTYAVSAITDGIRLTCAGSPSVGRFCTVLLLGGISAKALTFTPNATQNGTQASASLGFAPKAAFVIYIARTAADFSANPTATSVIGLGFADNTGLHRCLTSNASTGAADEALTLQYSETRCFTQTVGGATTFGGEITTWGADTFTMTTRDAATSSQLCFVLALGGADLSWDAGTYTTRTTTGNNVNATDVTPSAALVVLGTAVGTTVESDSNANGFMVGMADANGQFAHNMSMEDAAATTNCNSQASASALIDLDSSSGGSRTDAVTGTVTLNSADFTVNETTVDGSARKGYWVVFGTAAAGSAIKTINGLSRASVKTVNGLAIASMKARNGLA